VSHLKSLEREEIGKNRKKDINLLCVPNRWGLKKLMKVGSGK